MKLRHILILAISALLLSACNLTLAADVTPPPNYVAPTPAPTLGPGYPANAPDLANGEIIYAEKCAPCHGDTGLGNGPQSKDLPVSVSPIGLPETAQKSSPAKWHVTVTQGNIERFMPPFTSLSEQERWDVIAYAFSLHTTEDQIATGKTLFEENCADCGEMFTSQQMMAALSPNDLFRMMREGTGAIPAFGADFSNEEAYAVAAYIRTLTFAPPTAPVAVAVTETPVPAETEETPSAEETVEGGEQAQVTPEAGDVTPEATEVVEIVSVGKVSGLIENRSGADLPADLVIKLRGFDHGADPSAGPQEILNLETTVNADGTYAFETEIAERQIYLTEVDVDGLSYQSEFAVVEAGATELTLPNIIVYAATEDFSALTVDSLQIFFDLASEDTAQVFAVYTITNPSDKTILVKMGDGQNVPFIAFPAGASGLGYEATQDSAAFVPTADGFAMPPSDTPYGLIAFASLPKTKELSISQPALLAINGVTLFLPEGVEAESAALTDNGIQSIQTTNFHVYNASAIAQGASLDFTLTGEPKQTIVSPEPSQNQTLLIGVGALGLVLVLAGVWMYLRDNKKEEDFEDEGAEDEDDEFEDTDSIMDAIIALDDLHRSGKLSDEAYKKRRAELKEALKRKS
ncbi:MAG: cytochrome c [Anaerolineales bacterium]|nr:cytochrome c [Anaerolineales bacterium]